MTKEELKALEAQLRKFRNWYENESRCPDQTLCRALQYLTDRQKTLNEIDEALSTVSAHINFGNYDDPKLQP